MWTRASLDAARVLLRAVSRSVGGNSAEKGGNGAWWSLESSSAGTVELTSERRESLCNSTRLARTGVVWLPRNSRDFAPETISLWKFECASSGRGSPNLDRVESHQSSQEMTSPTPDNAVLNEEMRVWGIMTGHFFGSLVLSRVSETGPGGTA